MGMRKNLLPVLLVTSMLCTVPALAAPTPQDKLKQIEQTLATTKKDRAEYRKATRDAQELLDDLQKKLVTQTEKLQTTEKDVLAVHEKQTATRQAITSLNGELTKQRKTLADLLMAAQRLHRVPPEAMLLRPGQPIDAARTHLLLQRATPDIAQQATNIRHDLDRLASLKKDLAKQEQKLAKLQTRQKKQQDGLQAAIKDRKTLLAATQDKEEASSQTIAELNREAADIKAMLADLAKRSANPAPAREPVPASQAVTSLDKAAKTATRWGQSVMSFFSRGSGPSKLPITGRIRTSYGEKLASGANSQGLSIAGTPDGVVVAPEGGTVRFAGPFRQYRLLVIIEHAGGYHSLLGGLRDVYTKVGTKVAAGEPIGKLEHDEAHANLYYEVRRNGKPVDPRRSMRG